ncbi:MAG: nucleotidyltransferase domain-containing protein [Phascolarctobacterium sp.]
MCDEDKLKKITDDVVKAVLSVSNKVDSIILYGSQARGDSVEGSDIDILVIVNEPDEAIRGLKKSIWDYTNDISLEQDEVVSLILKSRREYNRFRDNLFYQNVARDGIVLYSSAFSKMTKVEIDAMLARGYQDALAGRHHDIDEVFDELDRHIGAYYTNKSIKTTMAMGSLTKEELDAEIEKGMDSIRIGRTFTADEVDVMLKRDFGI